MEKRLPVTTLSKSSTDVLILFLQKIHLGITLFILTGSELSQKASHFKKSSKRQRLANVCFNPEMWCGEVYMDIMCR